MDREAAEVEAKGQSTRGIVQHDADRPPQPLEVPASRRHPDGGLDGIGERSRQRLMLGSWGQINDRVHQARMTPNQRAVKP